MDAEWIIRIVLFSIVHWILAWVLIRDLASRERVFGKRKPPWALIILFIPGFGSILYLLFHPQILDSNCSKQGKDRNKNPK
jgi:hypothetical protein